MTSSLLNHTVRLPGMNQDPQVNKDTPITRITFQGLSDDLSEGKSQIFSLDKAKFFITHSVKYLFIKHNSYFAKITFHLDYNFVSKIQ